MSTHIGRICLSLSMSTLVSVVAFAQSRAIENGGPLSGLPPLNAPFIADATTTLVQRLDDGSLIQRKLAARYYRDSVGRVRVEQTTSASNGSALRILVFPDPSARFGYVLDPAARHATYTPRSIEDLTVGGGQNFAVSLGGFRFMDFRRSPAPLLERAGPPVADPVSDESLGNRQISGVETVGLRVTGVVPVGVLGNDKPIHIVDERWESPELKLLIYSRFSNSRYGDVEYRVTNVRRIEPPAELLEVPPEYTVSGMTSSGESWLSLSGPSTKPRTAK